MPPTQAWVADQLATDLQEVTSDLSRLDSGGRWFVVLPYSGEPVLCRFARWVTAERIPPAAWKAHEQWSSSMDQSAYCAAVSDARSAIASGTIYQVNLCRMMTAESRMQSIAGLFGRIQAGNPAPYAAMLDLPEVNLHIACASPELFLRRSAQQVLTGPIKGTGRTPSDLRAKDRAENVMIVDLMRNDLGRVCEPGSVQVPRFLATEEHPGLVHLVSDVSGHLRTHITWPEIVEATFPPGSVTGTPKSSALRVIDQLEPVSREIYCGVVGWIDSDAQQAELAVAIRTFWLRDGALHFGTGAGITWGSDPIDEWQETVLKAERLVGLAQG
jgi:para-aminobenzoate synthetase component 1